MDREQIEEHWRDKGNWAWGVIYRCWEDPHVIVPRRWRWGGWTLKFSHASAGPVSLAGAASSRHAPEKRRTLYYEILHADGCQLLFKWLIRTWNSTLPKDP